MKKMKRFAGPEGSMIEGDASVSEQMEQMPAKAAPAKKQTFGEAFAAARARGDKDFTWEGKPGMKFSTKMREDAPAKPAAKAEMAPSKPASKAEEPAKSAPKTSETKRGFGPYGVFAGPSDEEKAATYARYEENRKKMGATAAPSGSGKIADSDYAKSVRSSQAASADSGPLGKRIREALGSSYKTGGSVSKASSRADGIAQRGKTRGKMC